MIRKKVSVLLLVVLCVTFVAQTRGALTISEFFSPYNAKTFHKIVYESYQNPNLTNEEIKQELILAQASMELNDKAEYPYLDIMEMSSRLTGNNYSGLLYKNLKKYIKETSDLEAIRKSIKYLVEMTNKRSSREALLLGLLRYSRGKNNGVVSELATELAILSSEKADYESAITYLTEAYEADPYNKLAFAKLDELNRLTDRNLETIFYARHLRRSMVANPMDLEAAIGFAAYMEQLGIYTTASSIYEYSVELFGYLYPDRQLPASIYLPWAITSYNTRRYQGRCLQIARRIRQTGRFDIVIEAIAGNAARKMGDIKRSDELFQVGVKAENILVNKPDISEVTAEQIGWFYCFASPNTVKALAWTKNAYLINPKAPSVRAIYSYALAMNGENEKIKELTADIYQSNQIAAIVFAIAELAEQNNQSALKILKSAVGMDPGSLAAEKARMLLRENGSEYINPVLTEVVLQSLRADFGEGVVPRFIAADKIISVKLNLGGSELSYAKEIDAKLVVTNNSPSPLLIGAEGMFKGNIRVDAKVSGDINLNIPLLISKKIQFAAPVKPGRYISFPLDLMTGALRKLLLTHPQASLKIEFTVYIDPVVEADGTVRNTFESIEPLKTVIKRAGENITQRYLIQRFDTLSKGQMKQKIRSTQLFTGLLMEQYAMEGSNLSYDYKPVNRTLLIDAVRLSLADENWTVKIQSMAMLLMFPSPLHYEITRNVSENLNDSEWPVRMMSLYLLSKHQGSGFKPVLDWAAKYDSQEYVRSMAIALGGDRPPEDTKEAPVTEEQE